MKILELSEKLKKDGIPEDAYNLEGGFPDEAYCISESYNIWEVYYRERGNKTGLKIFNSESEACEYFLKNISEVFKLK